MKSFNNYTNEELIQYVKLSQPSTLLEKELSLRLSLYENDQEFITLVEEYKSDLNYRKISFITSASSIFLKKHLPENHNLMSLDAILAYIKKNVYADYKNLEPEYIWKKLLSLSKDFTEL